MILSMTGHGEAHSQSDGFVVCAEVRTINNRHFKLTCRGSEGRNWLESEIESLVRQRVRRGTVQVQLRIDRQSTAEDYRLDTTVLTSYQLQLSNTYDQLGKDHQVALEALLTLPGVVVEQSLAKDNAETEWPLIKQALTDALQCLDKMRQDEGQAMEKDLREQCHTINAELEKVQQQAPHVAEGYRRRLLDRMKGWLGELDVEVGESDILREVGLLAERSDISEETVRMRSHLEQFETILQLPESNGRKLDFLTQEMFREANTIGSKANDVEISRFVIEIKAAIERVREMVQNVE